MPISHKYKSIFVHIPKTGGTSIEKMMGVYGNQHENLRHSKSRYAISNIVYSPQHFTSEILKTHPLSSEYWEKYFKFSFVRNPYDRCLSEYFSHHFKGDNFDNKSFHKFLNIFYLDNDLIYDHKLKQVDYLNINGIISIDFVARFEYFKHDFNKITEKCGIRYHPIVMNKSKNKKDYSELLSIGNKNLIYKIFQEDFDTFKYRK